MMTMAERLRMESGDYDVALDMLLEDFEESDGEAMDEHMDLLDANEGFGLRIARGADMFDSEYDD